MSIQVKLLMTEARDCAAAITAAQNFALEYIAAKGLTRRQIISINQHTAELSSTSAPQAHACFITIWYDIERD